MSTIKQQIESLKSQIASEMQEHSAFMYILDKYAKEFIDENDQSKIVTVSEDGKSITILCQKEKTEETNGVYKGIYEKNVHSITIALSGILVYDKKRVAGLGFKHQNDSNGNPISDQADFDHSIDIYDDKNQTLKKARYIVHRKINDWRVKSYSSFEQYPQLAINDSFDIVFPVKIEEYERRDITYRDADGYFERKINTTTDKSVYMQCGYSDPQNWNLNAPNFLETHNQDGLFYDECGNPVELEEGEDLKSYFFPFSKTPGLN